MTDPTDDAATTDPAAAAAPTAGAAAAAAEEAARRRRLAEVFGDVLPDTSPNEPRPSRHDDQWYEENRPPHSV